MNTEVDTYELMAPYIAEGRDARQHGVDFAECPYVADATPNERHAWRMGWLGADEELNPEPPRMTLKQAVAAGASIATLVGEG